MSEGGRTAATLMIREYDQAWQHYRHVETARSQYLGFFFTAVLGSLGLLTNMLDDLSIVDAPMKVLGSLAIGWVLFVLSYFLFASVLKMGAVLAGYERVMALAREYFYAHADETEVAYTAKVGVGDGGDPLFGRRLFGTQRSAEMIFRGCCYAIFAGVSVSAVHVLDTTPAGLAYRLVVGAFPVTMFASLAYLEHALHRGRRSIVITQD